MHTEPTTDPAGRGVTSDAGSDGGGTASTCTCWSRRESLLAAGVAVVATAGLAACGSGDEDAAGGATSGATGASQVVAKADVPVGGGVILDGIKVVVTQPTEGDFKAFSAICTHRQCTVTSVEDNVILCRCHLSEFDAATGAVRKGPATQALPAKSVAVDGDGLTVT